jgi:hypothetical protein
MPTAAPDFSDGKDLWSFGLFDDEPDQQHRASNTEATMSPDGMRVAFTEPRRQPGGLRGQRGWLPFNLTNNPANDSAPAWFRTARASPLFRPRRQPEIY